jgi:hypothetical protein
MSEENERRNPLLMLIYLEGTKREVEKFAREIVVTDEDMGKAFLGAGLGLVEPYLYARHFKTLTPQHLVPTKMDIAAIAANGVGELKPAGKKTMRKVRQIFADRRMFCAHLLYLPSKEQWHLIYFDQRDMSTEGNHWKKGGSHFHYSRETFVNISMDEMWSRVRAEIPNPPPSMHVRYMETLEQDDDDE